MLSPGSSRLRAFLDQAKRNPLVPHEYIDLLELIVSDPRADVALRLAEKDPEKLCIAIFCSLAEQFSRENASRLIEAAQRRLDDMRLALATIESLRKNPVVDKMVFHFTTHKQILITAGEVTEHNKIADELLRQEREKLRQARRHPETYLKSEIQLTEQSIAIMTEAHRARKSQKATGVWPQAFMASLAVGLEHFFGSPNHAAVAEITAIGFAESPDADLSADAVKKALRRERKRLANEPPIYAAVIDYVLAGFRGAAPPPGVLHDPAHPDPFASYMHTIYAQQKLLRSQSVTTRRGRFRPPSPPKNP